MWTRSLTLTLFLLLCACAPAAAPVPVTAAIPLPAPVVTHQRDFQPIAQQTATPTANAPCTGGADRTRYLVSLHVNYAERGVDAQQTVDYTNHDHLPLQEIVFYVEPTRWDGAFNLAGVFDGTGTPIASTLRRQRLTVTLPAPVAPGCVARVQLAFRLDVPALDGGVNAYKGYLSYSADQLNLGYWLPMVAPRRDGEWVTHETVFIGEQAVLDAADWDVTLDVTDSPAPVIAAAPGTVTTLADNRWRFNADGLRDFALSLSTGFSIQTAQTPNGVTVELYTLPTTPAAAAAHALDVAVKSLAMYADLFGAYPLERLVVVDGAFPDGIEFAGLVFVSSDWFARYTGDPASYLTLITVHEVSHQWWYASVGNDSALHPWLDEALATYSEYIFLEEYYPELKDWWWEFRVNRFTPQGAVDSTVYEFSSIREYINAVYLRGVLLLRDLRADLGTESFFAWLRAYADAGQGRIATPDLLWSLLTPEQLAQTAATRARYLQGGG